MISSHASFSKNYAHSVAVGKQDREQIIRKMDRLPAELSGKAHFPFLWSRAKESHSASLALWSEAGPGTQASLMATIGLT